MRVVGLDLSLTATGVAAEDGPLVLSTSLRGMERLAWLQEEVWITSSTCLTDGCSCDGYHPPDLVVLEGYAYGRLNQGHQLGELGGAVRLTLHREGVPFVDVPPACLKKYATGRGNAGKEEVLAAAIRRLSYGGHDHNEADALWLRAMAVDHYDCGGEPCLVPASHRQALQKVEWPELAAVSS